MIVVSRVGDVGRKEWLDSLERDCKRFRLRYHFQTEPDDLNLPEFILEVMKEMPEEGEILYLEPGAMIRRPPRLLEEYDDFDIAMHIHKVGIVNPSPTQRKFDGVGWPMGLTFLFRRTELTEVILEQWAASLRSKFHPEEDYMKTLLFILGSANIRMLYLPPEYSWVRRAMEKVYGPRHPVIEHLAPRMKGAPQKIQEGKRQDILVRPYSGMGDTFYARPAVREILRTEGAPIYVQTPWPQLWQMEGVRPVKPAIMGLRTQKENMGRTQDDQWFKRPLNPWEYRLEYGRDDLIDRGQTAPKQFLNCLGWNVQPTWEDYKFDVPQEWITDRIRALPRPFGVVKQPTVRKEWKCPSRNPMPRYIPHLVKEHPEVTWVSVGWVDPEREPLEGQPIEGLHTRFERGELDITELVAMVSEAAVALTPPCFLLPMAAAVETPTFCVFGGSLPPSALVDQCMGTHVSYVAPEPFCRCGTNEHNCHKEIPLARLTESFNKFMRKRIP